MQESISSVPYVQLHISINEGLEIVTAASSAVTNVEVADSAIAVSRGTLAAGELGRAPNLEFLKRLYALCLTKKTSTPLQKRRLMTMHVDYRDNEIVSASSCNIGAASCENLNNIQ